MRSVEELEVSKIAIPVQWLKFSNTHELQAICLQGCVIHHRTAHHMQWWPLHWRSDRSIFERICEHGIGHPDPDQYPYWREINDMAQAVHGCDGCCIP